MKGRKRHTARARADTPDVATAADVLSMLHERDGQGRVATRVASLARTVRAFKTLLEHAVPALLERARRGDSLRVWVCRCATGEAAYALAMTLCERLLAAQCDPDLRIFATDIDAQALTIARNGIYSTAATRQLPREQFEQFLNRRGREGYRVSRALRDKIVFAEHDWLYDPPFTELDLILSVGALDVAPERRREVCERFHFALRDGGLLMLSNGESLDASLKAELFVPLRPRLRLYRRIVPPSWRAGQLPRAWRSKPADPETLLRRALLDDAPSALLVAGDFTILAAHGSIAGHLRSPFVEPRANLLTVLSAELAGRLKAAGQSLLRTSAPTAALIVQGLPGTSSASIRIRRVDTGAQPQPMLAVSFHEDAPMAEPADVRLDERGKLFSEGLHGDLATLRQAHAEVESARQELASLKEEYKSVHLELAARVAELSRVNADIAGLLDSTLSVLFLDERLRIRRFSPAAAALLRIGDRDVGRSIPELETEFRGEHALREDCELALKHLKPVERPVETRNHSWFSRRVFPYRSSSEPHAAGLIVTFTDISEGLRARRAVIEGDYWRRLVEHLPVGAALVADGRLHLNQAMESLTAYSRDELTTPQLWFAALFGPRAEEMYALYQAEAKRGFPDLIVFTITRKDGAKRTVEWRGTGYEGGELHVLHDVTEKHFLQGKVLDLVAKEQRAVGQELHDTVMQDLSALGLLAASLVDQLPIDSAERKRAERLAAGIGGLNGAAQRIAEGLLPLPMEGGDLGGALDALAARTTAQHGLRCRVSKPASIEVESHSSHELYRIAQEALMNVVRHANAENVDIRVEQDSNATTLEILDDGVGVPQAGRSTGLGTRIMRYRCELIGGRFARHARSSGGTRVMCIVPRGVNLEKAS